MSVNAFGVEGIDLVGELGNKLGVKLMGDINKASNIGVNKTADLIAFGRVSNIKPSTVKPESAVYKAAKALRIPVEHMMYRTFVKPIKSRGQMKPWSSIMMRGNSINVVDLVATGSAAQLQYGYKSRKRSVSGKVRFDVKNKVSQLRVGGRRGKKVRIAGRVYNNSFLEDGSYRNSSKAISRFYRNSLGASATKSGLKGSRYLLIQRKSSNQSRPYPSIAVKIKKTKVMNALNLAATLMARRRSSEIEAMQLREVHRVLKKWGFVIS